MHIILLLLLTVLNVFCSSPTTFPTEHAYQDGKILRVPLNDTASEDLLEKWLSQAVSGLMAAVASRRIIHMDDEDRKNVHSCSRLAQNVPEHARCVVKVLDATKNIRSTVPIKNKPDTHVKHKPWKKNASAIWVGDFRIDRNKRETSITKAVNRVSYTLKTEQDENLFSKVARQMTKTVRKLKNKQGSEGWRQAVARVKEVAKDAKEEKKRRETFKKRLRLMIDNTPDQFIDPRKPIAMKELEMEEENLVKKKALAKEKSDEVRVPLQVMRESIKLAMEMAGQNTTGFDKKTLKLVSPRFMSIMPEQEENSLFNLLSPSLFSLHDEGSPLEQLTSLPQLLKQLGNTDQEAWMDFIVEASGVTDALDKTQNEQKEKREQELRGTGGVPLYFTKQNVSETMGREEVTKIETFEQLDRSYNKEQRNDLDKQGYSFLTREQLEIVYGDGSPYNMSNVLRNFKDMRLKDDPHHMIEHDIRALAEAEKFKMRRHDIVKSPFVLTPLTYAGKALSQPIILSPLVLSPITLSPAVLGPIVLSPWVFIPLILSPRVLSPLILSPLVFSPIILSPLVLHPLILVPGVFNPFILSPMVLSPLILSPQVFSPLILSPFVLNPLILTPMFGSPLVLSPFVLSPIILSPQALFAVVLSPYALSPLVESKLISSEIILSPSWLS